MESVQGQLLEAAEDSELRSTIIRWVVLLVPVAFAFYGLVRRLDARADPPSDVTPLTSGSVAAMIVSTIYVFLSTFALSVIALHMGWWSFEVRGGVWLGVPIDLHLGWAVLWGMLPTLLLTKRPLWLSVFGFGVLDLLVMGNMSPVLQLHSMWWVGELLALCLILAPALIVARLTEEGRALEVRAMSQMVVFGALTFLLFPAVALTVGDGVLPDLEPHSSALWMQAVALPGVLALSAVHDFVAYGKGTPLPFDPPQRLVTRGLYAYLANPMQLFAKVALLVVACWVSSRWLALGTLSTAVFSLGVARYEERHALSGRFGEQHASYRQSVRAWIPSFKPYVPKPATYVYLAGCDDCEWLRNWLALRHPVGLRFVQSHQWRDGRARRVTYEADGVAVTGVAAVGRALEHINLAWALLGIVLRLPGLSHGLQFVVDIFGGGPLQFSEQVAQDDSALTPDQLSLSSACELRAESTDQR